MKTFWYQLSATLIILSPYEDAWTQLLKRIIRIREIRIDDRCSLSRFLYFDVFMIFKYFNYQLFTLPNLIFFSILSQDKHFYQNNKTDCNWHQKDLFIINSFSNNIQMQIDWQFPEKKQYPLSITFTPNLIDNSEHFLNPFFGYPNCPIIGRYNRGQYKIGETLMQVQFKCKYNKNTQLYQCGQKVIMLPEIMHHNIRNIAEVIENNKPANLKNVPDFLPEKFPVLDELSIIWIVSFGELGKDFLNYLNHMYILANTLFQQEKLPRQVHYLPIYAYLPERSGIHPGQVEKGLNFNNYRAEYMSFHLSKGAPAFSPNNMRLGVEGGKIITHKPPPPKNKKGGKKQHEKPQPKENKQEYKRVVSQQDRQQQQFDFEKFLSTPAQNLPKQQSKIKQQTKEQKQHQGFIHFYTSVLLEHDYRVYYHWHIEDHYKEDMIKEILRSSMSVEDFIDKYCNVLGKDPLYYQINRLLYPGKF